MAIVLTATAAPAEAQVVTGTMSINLAPPAGVSLTHSTFAITNASIAFTRGAAFGAGPGGFSVPNLPAANDYTVNVVSNSTTGTTCRGTGLGVPIVANATTIEFIQLTCGTAAPTPVPALGPHAPLLFLSLALIGAIAVRRRARSA